MDSAALFSASRRRAIAWSPGRRFGVSLRVGCLRWGTQRRKDTPESPVTVPVVIGDDEARVADMRSPVTRSAVRGVLARWMLTCGTQRRKDTPNRRSACQ